MAALAKRSAADLFNNPTLSDVIIKQHASDGIVRDHYADKAVLCMEFRFFHKAFTGKFKEASENVNELYDDHADHFEFLLRYIYTNEYDRDAFEKLATENETTRVTVPIGIYIVANEYEVTTVCDLALENMEDVLKSPREQEKTTELLLASCRIHYSFAPGPGLPMGELLVSTILDYQQSFPDSDTFDDLVNAYPSLGVDFTMAMKRRGRLSLRDFVCQVPTCRFAQTVSANRLRKEDAMSVYCQKCGAQHPIREIVD